MQREASFKPDARSDFSIERMLLGVIAEAGMWHLTNGARIGGIRAKIENGCSRKFLHDAPVSVAPVRFTRSPSASKCGRFDIDESGRRYSIVIPCRDEFGDLIDVAAFDPMPPYGVATYLGRAIALGLDEIFESRHDPNFRVPMTIDILDYLAVEGRMMLPLDWRLTGLHLLARRVRGIVAPRVQTGKIIERRLAQALKPLPVFVKAMAA